MKPLKFPVAQIRAADGVPAVWLTFENWLAIKDGLVRRYLDQREYIGTRAARLAAGKPDSLDTWGQHFETSARDAALELYRVGYEAHRATHERTDREPFTPEKLVALGDKREARACEEQAKRLASLNTPALNSQPTSPHEA